MPAAVLGSRIAAASETKAPIRVRSVSLYQMDRLT